MLPLKPAAPVSLGTSRFHPCNYRCCCCCSKCSCCCCRCWYRLRRWRVFGVRCVMLCVVSCCALCWSRIHCAVPEGVPECVACRRGWCRQTAEGQVQCRCVLHGAGVGVSCRQQTPSPPPNQPTPVHTSPSCVLRNTRCRLLLRSNTLWAASVPEGTRLSFVDLATAEEVQAVQDAWRTVAADPDFGHDFAPAPSCQVEALPPPRKSRHVCTTL
jgi:hypothetical protein